jgi:hypothetical protein
VFDLLLLIVDAEVAVSAKGILLFKSCAICGDPC